VRLRGDEAFALEDAPDGRQRGHSVDLADEVVGDGVGPGVVTGGDELLTKLENFALNLGRCLVGAGVGPARSWG
jgi:hypothetical protein